MIRLNLDKVQAEFVPSYELTKLKLEDAKKAAMERAKADVINSEMYKAEVERHNAELVAIAESYVAEQTATDPAVVGLEAAVKVYEDFTIVDVEPVIITA